MKEGASGKLVQQIRVHPQELDSKQPLARFMISLFNLFEDEVISKLTNTPFKEISRTDLHTLRYIDQAGVTITQLAHFAGITKQAMSKQVENLTARGFLKKMTDQDDGRAYKIVFTEKGSDLIRFVVPIIQEIERRYERTLGKTEYAKIKQHLRKLISLYGPSRSK